MKCQKMFPEFLILEVANSGVSSGSQLSVSRMWNIFCIQNTFLPPSYCGTLVTLEIFDFLLLMDFPFLKYEGSENHKI